MQRWAAKVRLPEHWKEEACWEWIGAANANGYGHFMERLGKMTTPYRYSYERFIGPVPEGLTIDHLCRNRRCVNPEHLEAVTQGVNVLRSPLAAPAVNARKTHCDHGHQITEEHQVYRVVGKNGRICRECAKARENRKYASDPALRERKKAHARAYHRGHSK